MPLGDFDFDDNNFNGFDNSAINQNIAGCRNSFLGNCRSLRGLGFSENTIIYPTNIDEI